MEENFNGQQTSLPNATAILVLGILSIPTCCCYGIVGIILAIIALVLAGSAEKRYNSAAENYTLSSLKNVKAGRICAIIGLILGVLYLIWTVYILTHPALRNEYMDRLPDILRRYSM